MRYLDSNVFIYLALSPMTEAKAISARNIVEDMVDSSEGGTTSALTWDELVWAVKKMEGKEVARKEGKKFISFPRLTIVSVSDNTLNVAQDIMERYGLDPRDAIHAACCIEHDIDEIISDDPDFDKVKEIKRIPLEKAV